MWLESPITFLHCVHEARMKKIVHLPPPSEKQIYIVQVMSSRFAPHHHICYQTKMAIHDIVATTYYLENYDRSKINLEVELKLSSPGQ